MKCCLTTKEKAGTRFTSDVLKKIEGSVKQTQDTKDCILDKSAHKKLPGKASSQKRRKCLSKAEVQNEEWTQTGMRDLSG